MMATETVWKAGNSFLRHARRDWRCDCRIRSEAHGEDPEVHGFLKDCPEVICKGDQYLESVDSAPAYQSGDRYCMPCAWHNGLLADRQPYSHLGTCLVRYPERFADARDCACGGEPNQWYSEAAL